MTDYRAEAEQHLEQAATFAPGTEQERYHSHTASVFASLYAGGAQREQASAAERLIALQERLFEAMVAPQQAASEEPTP